MSLEYAYHDQGHDMYTYTCPSCNRSRLVYDGEDPDCYCEEETT